MRTIRFRGKPVDSGEWVYGDLLQIKDVAYIINYDFEEHHDTNDSELWTLSEKVIPESLGQFTGLQDNHGTDIFEGDKLKLTDSDGNTWETTVRFSEGGFLIDVEHNDFNITCIGFLEEETTIEIIGNVHQDKLKS